MLHEWQIFTEWGMGTGGDRGCGQHNSASKFTSSVSDFLVVTFLKFFNGVTFTAQIFTVLPQDGKRIVNGV